MAIHSKRKVCHNGVESKMVSPIQSGTPFLVLHSPTVLEKEIISNLFTLPNVAAVNKANKMPTWRRNRWK